MAKILLAFDLFFYRLLDVFAKETIGTKVTDRKSFTTLLTKAIGEWELPPDDRFAAFIQMTKEDRENWYLHITELDGKYKLILLEKVIQNLCSCAYGPRSTNPNDYVIRNNNGQPVMYLKRELASPPKGCMVEVMRRERYIREITEVTKNRCSAGLPDIELMDEVIRDRIAEVGDATHFITDIFAFPHNPFPPSDTTLLDDGIEEFHNALYWSRGSYTSFVENMSTKLHSMLYSLERKSVPKKGNISEKEMWWKEDFHRRWVMVAD